MNTKLFTLTFTIALKAVKIWLESQGLELNALVEEWVSHFFFGGGVDKTLPYEAIEETKIAVKKQLWFLWDYPSWLIHVARVGNTTEWHGFFTSLMGVVGGFNFTFEEQKKGLKVKCVDCWDFNTRQVITDPLTGKEHQMSAELEVSIDSAPVQNVIKSLACRLGITIHEGDNPSTLWVDEENLASLNPSRQFYTRWEFFLSWEELGVENPEDYDWANGGLPKWWLQQEAMKRAVDKLPKVYTMYKDSGEIPESLIDWDTGIEYPYTWDSINTLRSLYPKRQRRESK